MIDVWLWTKRKKWRRRYVDGDLELWRHAQGFNVKPFGMFSYELNEKPWPVYMVGRKSWALDYHHAKWRNRNG